MKIPSVPILEKCEAQEGDIPLPITSVLHGFFFVSIWLLCLLMPVYRSSILHLGTSWYSIDYDFILLVLGICWLVWHFGKQRAPESFLPSSLCLPLVAFFGWLLTSTVTAVDQPGAWSDFLSWVAHLLAFFMFIDVIRTRRQLFYLACALLVGNGYLGLACTIDYFGGVYRIGGPGKYWPTVLGCYLNFALPWTLCIFYGTKNSNFRFLIGLVVFFLIFSLGATLARSALIGFFVSLVIIFGYLTRRGRWRFQALLIPLFLLLLLFPSFLNRMFLIGSETLGNIEFSRPVFWERSLSLLDDSSFNLDRGGTQAIPTSQGGGGLRLMTGVGMGNSYHLVFRSEPMALIDSRFYDLPHAHNFIIHYLIIWGLPGLLAYLWFLGSYVQTVFTTFHHYSWGLERNDARIPLGQWIQCVALASLAGFWVEELFHVSVLYRNNMTFYWWTLALGIVGGRLKDEGEAP